MIQQAGDVVCQLLEKGDDNFVWDKERTLRQSVVFGFLVTPINHWYVMTVMTRVSLKTSLISHPQAYKVANSLYKLVIH